MTVKPPALAAGDTIGIVAPSWCGPARYPGRVERGAKFLRSQGYEVIVAPHAYGKDDYVSGTPEERVADIHQMFADESVRAIVAAIGGAHSCHLLPLLDWSLIGRHPKIFMGFSDISVLNLAIHRRTGLITFNGPMIMSEFAEDPSPLAYTLDYAWRALCRSMPVGEIVPAAEWTDDFLYWATDAELTNPRPLRPSPGWTWLRAGIAEGPLIGGCIESIEHLRGTGYWPEMQGAILFLETSEEKPSLATVDAMLQDYDNMGVFGQIAGLLFGRSMGYHESQRAGLRSLLLERTRNYGFPIVSDMDFGHIGPQVTLPIGCTACIDSAKGRVAITEAAVAAR